jgi:hypothetical protein
MTVWRPWDADDDEYAQRLEIKALVPEPLRPFLHSWLASELNTAGYARAEPGTVHALQSAFGVNFGFAAGRVSTQDLVDRIASEGDRFLMQVVDYVAASYEDKSYAPTPKEIDLLSWHLDQNMSAVQVLPDASQVYRVTRRLPLGVEDSGTDAVDRSSEEAGRHLIKAWSAMRSLTPDTSLVMTEAIRAVEAAAGPVVIPKDKQQRLGKIVQTLKARETWGLVLRRRDDDVPDHRLVLIGMMETLAFAEQHRHGGEAPSVLEALTHVQLASTLVAWFATGAVVDKLID